MQNLTLNTPSTQFARFFLIGIRINHGGTPMHNDTIKATEEIVSCSDNGQHPLVYISLKTGSGQCQYCGQKFVRISKSGAAEKVAA